MEKQKYSLCQIGTYWTFSKTSQNWDYFKNEVRCFSFKLKNWRLLICLKLNLVCNTEVKRGSQVVTFPCPPKSLGIGVIILYINIFTLQPQFHCKVPVKKRLVTFSDWYNEVAGVPFIALRKYMQSLTISQDSDY